jgi:hypothetical protein
MFKVDEDCEKLALVKAVEFHNLVAKTLYATKRARPDTYTAIAFLATRVHEPDKDDWTKLVHLMRYIRSTCTMPLLLSANGSGTLKWWVDASFVVHPNMRDHSGGGLSLGRGFPIVRTGLLSLRSARRSQLVVPSFHSTHKCQPLVVSLTFLLLPYFMYISTGSMVCPSVL